MKKNTSYLCFSLLLSIATIGNVYADSNDDISFQSADVKTIFLPMSQGSNLYTQYHKVMYLDEPCFNLDISATYRYQRTRDAEDIAAHLFQHNPLTFQGSEVDNRSDSAFIADYFGLSSDTNATLKLNPRIQNHIIDLQASIAFDQVCEGLWVQANFPLVHTDWDLRFDQETGDLGSGNLDIEKEAKAGSTTALKTLTSAEEGMASQVPNSITLTNFNSTTNLVQELSGSTAKPENIFEKAFTYGGDNHLQSAGYMTSLTVSSTTSNTVESPNSFGITSPTAKKQSTSVLKEASTSDSPTFSNNTNGSASGVVTITRPAVSAPSSIAAALEGDHVFGDFEQRKYNIIGNGTGGSIPSNDPKKSPLINPSRDDDKFGLADIHLQIGYDLWKEQDYHFSLYLKSVIPTGTKIDEEHSAFAFSPVIGNGKHFELGLGMNAHHELWCCDDSKVNVYMDGYITHMFSKKQFRTFDLVNKPVSRYLLVKELDESGDSGLESGDTDRQDYAYAGKLIQAGDLNAGEVEVTAASHGEFILDFVYSHCNWEAGLGYGLAYQAKEKVDESFVRKTQETSGNYGLKGDTFLSDIKLAMPIQTSADAIPVISPVTSQVASVLFRGNGDICPDATIYSTGTQVAAEDKHLLSFPEADVISSGANRSGLMESQILHRIFGHIDYTWNDSCWLPSFGIVGSIGFTGASNLTAQYWDIGARMGFNY